MPAGPAWHAIAQGGKELDYAQITANVVQANGANGEFDIPGLVVNPVVGFRPVYVEAFVQMVSHTAAAAIAVLKLYEDGVAVASANLYLPAANNGAAMRVAARRSPASGAHQYKARLFVTAAGTYTIYASPTSIGFITATER